MNRLNGKRIIVTGGASGIGRKVAERYLKEGASVVIADIVDPVSFDPNDNALEGAHFIRFNASNESDIRELIDRSADILGGLDVLAQIAGIQVSGKVEAFDINDFNRMMAINVAAYFHGIKYAMPHLQKTGKGSIINMASVAGKRGGPGMSIYSATKGAVIAMTGSLGRELARRAIRVNAVCPGWVDTNFNEPAIQNLGGLEAQNIAIQNNVPMGRQAEPQEIAGIFVYLASDDSSFVTAQSFSIDGGVT